MASFNKNNDISAVSNQDDNKKDTIMNDNNDSSNDNNDYDNDEFTCKICDTTQGLNNCEMCDKENICEYCEGQGGDYGPNEIWVCHECLPVCLECKSKLISSYDTCCGKGRSDLSDEEDTDDNKKKSIIFTNS